MAEKKEKWEIEADMIEKFFEGESDTLTIDLSLEDDPIKEPKK